MILGDFFICFKRPFEGYFTLSYTKVLIASHPKVSSLKQKSHNGPSLYYVSIFLAFLYPNHPPYQHKYSTERQQNWPFYRPTHTPSHFADVIYVWFLTYDKVGFSPIAFMNLIMFVT